MAFPFSTLSVRLIPEGYAVLELARPKKSNAVSLEMWEELPQVRCSLSVDSLLSSCYLFFQYDQANTIV